jgi:hypothetical protein
MLSSYLHLKVLLVKRVYLNKGNFAEKISFTKKI